VAVLPIDGGAQGYSCRYVPRLQQPSC
jgi:hypothetical protein